MGKRSAFKRRDKDTYDTFDPRAVARLAPHLPAGVRYWEPCAGKGDLVRGLAEHGHECVVATDLQPRAEGIYRLDAMATTRADVDATCVSHIITNPVWSRPLLHRMIWHFMNLRPTWLLFDADWFHTTQASMAKGAGVHSASELRKHCAKVVCVGRLRWIEGTVMSGKDNCAWHLFDINHSGPAALIGMD